MSYLSRAFIDCFGWRGVKHEELECFSAAVLDICHTPPNVFKILLADRAFRWISIPFERSESYSGKYLANTRYSERSVGTRCAERS